MEKSKKIRVMVLYGGRSGEHEVSLRSAASVIQRLDSKRFDVFPVAIDKLGRWLPLNLSRWEHHSSTLPVDQSAQPIVLLPQPCSDGLKLVEIETGRQLPPVDVVFPVMHGTLCEDGTLQGLLEMADAPYVGCGVLASSVGMDKDIAKKVMRDAGIPVVPYLCIRQAQWKNHPKEVIADVDRFQYPVFIKPSNSGSSVGVHKVKEVSQLKAALDDAFSYDSKVLVEKAIDAREVEFAVLENSDPNAAPLVSIPGEIVPTHEFYSYDAKYLDEQGAKLLIPAPIDSKVLALGQDIARKTFTALELEGLARVDLFLDRQRGEYYVNEVNTLPGFTSISMYPKLWEHSGVGYTELLSRLIDLALARQERKKLLKRDFSVHSGAE